MIENKSKRLEENKEGFKSKLIKKKKMVTLWSDRCVNQLHCGNYFTNYMCIKTSTRVP